MASGHTDTTSGVSKSASKACDRCRGQKLRCVWERTNSRQCQRCARAKTTCVVPRPRPMGRPPQSLRQNRNAGHCEWNDGTSAPYSESSSVAVPADADLKKSADGTRSLSSTGTHVDFIEDIAEIPWITLGNRSPDLSTDSRANLISPMSSDLTEFIDMTFLAPGFSNQVATGCPITDPDAQNGHGYGITDSDQSLEASNEVSSTNTITSPNDNVEVSSNKAQKHGNPSHENVGCQIQLLTELCELNLALYQHPLHQAVEQARLEASNQIAPASGSATPADDKDPTLNLANLETGQLLSMSARVRNILASLLPIDPTRAEADTTWIRPGAPDQSTLFLAMSCCSRLEVILTSTLDRIRDAQSRGLRFKKCQELMPKLSVDGFALVHCHDIHLGFVIQTFEKARDSIRTVMKAAEDFHSTHHRGITS